MRGWLWLVVLAVAGCDSGGGGGSAPVDAAPADAALDAAAADRGLDVGVPPDEGLAPDAAAPDAEVAPDAMRRRPVGADAPRVRECPATPRLPQVVLAEATGAAERTYDGPVTVISRAGGEVTLGLPDGSLRLGVPPRVAALFNEDAMFDALLRRRSMGFTEWILVLRQEGRLVFAAMDGTSWVLQQFAERAAVGEAVDLAGGCAEAGERCFDRVDREIVFAGGNRRRALLPGTETDFTTDGGSFVLAVDQAYQVACQVLCPNVATQGFSVWLLRTPEAPRAGDFDGDGVDDAVDVCVAVPDPEQADADGDGVGDACPAPVDACAHPMDCASRRCDGGLCVGAPYVVPGAPEVCDGDDDDGDGTADEGLDGCAPETWCLVTAEVAGDALARGAAGELVATVTSGCPDVTISRVAWDLGPDGREDGEGERLALRALRGLDAAGVLRVEDSRGGVTEVPFRVPVATSEFCP